MIQIMPNCEDYTPNENRNKTCRNQKWCKLINEDNCYEYKERKTKNELRKKH